MQKQILFLLLSISPFSIQAEWTSPYNGYLFAPGLWSSEQQVGKYCSKYVASTGQTVKGSHGFEVIQGDYCKSCNFAEITVPTVASVERARNSWWPLQILLHGIYTLGGAILEKSNNRYKVSLEGHSQNGLTLNPHLINFFNLNFGQKRDIAALSAVYDESCAHAMPEKMVLFGTSRGAAAIIHFIALEYEKKPEQRVKALVLEGCFDSMENLTWLSYPLSLITAYEYKGISPVHPSILKRFIEVCDLQGISVLFVTSRCDQRVPAARSYALYEALLKEGHKDVTLLELKNSTHSAYMKDDDEDKRLYEAVVHDFYKKNNLSYDPDRVFAVEA
jgi:hypothetical protein